MSVPVMAPKKGESLRRRWPNSGHGIAVRDPDDVGAGLTGMAIVVTVR
jgi:hypothetical protein